MSGLARRQLTLDNTVAAELAGSEDVVLRALRGHMGDVDFHLRGNVLTLDGDSGDVQTAATVVDELVELIEGYLPQQLSDEELAGLVEAAVEETGASEQRQMGDVMKALMPKVGGRADGKRVSAAVRERLGS